MIVARLVPQAAETPRAQLLLTELQALEGKINALRVRRDEMETDLYWNALQELLLELALVQRQIDEEQAAQ